MRVQQIRAGLWRWTGLHPAWSTSSVGWAQEVGCVFLEADEAVVLIDPLVPPEDEARFWSLLDGDIERLGRPVVVLLTAPWHVRSADAMLERYGGTLWAHPAGAERLGRPIDALLPEGVEALEVPPLREGQVALYLAAHAAVVTAEILTGVDSSLRICPSPGLLDSERLRPFLRLLLELPTEVMLPAHGEPVFGNGRAAVAAAVAHWAPSAP